LWLSKGLLRLSEGLLRLTEALLRLSKGLLRLSEGWGGGKGWLQGLLLSLTPLLELEGGVWLLLLLGLLRQEGGGRLSEGWLGCRLLLGGEQLGVGGVGWVDEGVHSGTVRTGGHRGSAGQAGLLELLSLHWSRLSLHWSRLELLSLDWSRLELLSLSWNLLSWLFGSELSSVNVSLEIQVGRVSRVDERIEVSAGNLRLWLLWLLLWLLSYKLWLLLSLLGRSHRSTSDWSHRSGLFSDRSSLRLGWRRLLRFSLGNLWVEGSALKTIGSLRDVVSLQDPEPVLTSGVPHSDGLTVLVNVAVLTNPLPVSSRLLPEHRPVLLGEG